jgi:hypothetical protein
VKKGSKKVADLFLAHLLNGGRRQALPIAAITLGARIETLVLTRFRSRHKG